MPGEQDFSEKWGFLKAQISVGNKSVVKVFVRFRVEGKCTNRQDWLMQGSQRLPQVSKA